MVTIKINFKEKEIGNVKVEIVPPKDLEKSKENEVYVASKFLDLLDKTVKEMKNENKDL